MAIDVVLLYLLAKMRRWVSWIDYPKYDRSLMQQTCDALRHKIFDGKMLTNYWQIVDKMFYIHILGLFVIFFDWIIKCWSISSGVHFLGGPRPNTLWHCWTHANFVLEHGNLTVPAGHSVGREWPWKLFKILMANPLLTLLVAPTAKIWIAKKIIIIWTFIFTVMTFYRYLWFFVFRVLIFWWI